MGLKEAKSLENLDIVYCLKESTSYEEFRYSLRSLKNIPHRNVWVYGGCPDWVKNVNCVKVVQNKDNKWNNTAFLLKQICKNNEISEDFIWFNDDFFVLKEVDNLPYYYDRTLSARILDFKKRFPLRFNIPYCNRLRWAERCLKMRNKTTLNYELHLPIIFNRGKLSQICNVWESIGAKRSLYCNFFLKEGVQRDDVKIYDDESVPTDDWDFVSTSDRSFLVGKVGEYIRKKFNRRCKYEQIIKG